MHLGSLCPGGRPSWPPTAGGLAWGTLAGDDPRGSWQLCSTSFLRCGCKTCVHWPLAEPSKAAWLLCELTPLFLGPQTHIPKAPGLVLLPLHVPLTSQPQLVPNGACSPPPNLLLLSPPRCWGAILPFSFTSRERNHLSLSSLPSKSPSDSSLHPLNHVPGPGHQPSPLGPQARSPGRSGWVAPWGSGQWWAAFACPAGGPRGPWGLCCLICLPLGWQHLPPSTQTICA